MNPAKNQRKKQRCQDLSVLDGPRLRTIFFFVRHTLCMNYVTKAFLLVGSSVSTKQLLCFVLSQGKKKENKNIQQKTLSGFITIPLC